MRLNEPLRLKTFPGALYTGDGTLLAGDGPDMTDELAAGFPHKALVSNKPGNIDVAVLKESDRLWVLPESFGAPAILPTLLLVDLVELVRAGRRVGLAAHDLTVYEQVRDALMLLLDNTGGHA